MTVTGKTVLVGVAGGIAAYKAAWLVSRLRQLGACVQVVMTDAACRFVTPLTFETLSGRRVVTSLFENRPTPDPQHIAIAQAAQVAVVAPATANIIAKLAHGIADDALSTTLISTRAPIIVCPGMNDTMWANPAVQQNVQTLRDRGATIVGPGKGWLACGTEGIGRMAEPDEILEAVFEAAQRIPEP